MLVGNIMSNRTPSIQLTYRVKDITPDARAPRLQAAITLESRPQKINHTHSRHAPNWQGLQPAVGPNRPGTPPATPLVKEDVVKDVSHPSLENEAGMAVAEPIARLVSPTPVGDDDPMNKSGHANVAVTVIEQTHSKESSLDYIEHPKDRVVSFSTDESSAQDPRTPSRSISASSQSRIEDSVEAIDRLEEQLEAVNAAAQIHLATPTKSHRTRMADESITTNNTFIKRTASTLKRTQSARFGVKPTSNAQATHRKSTSTSLGNDPEKTLPASAPTRRSTVARPVSLLPPKPPAKSTKPPTRPSFELPGEAVARKIKEQREARLAQQAQGKVSAPTTPQRTRSLKAPTRPNFELPGEVISRRKREEHEARLKAQAEEERKRREFKARPIKANLGSAALPRETVASRARQNKGSEASETSRVEESPSKRTSIMGTPRTPLTRSASTRSPQARGRGTSQTEASHQLSRATSTSTGSMSGKGSTLSAEDLEQQKIKGRQIFRRDNRFIEDKGRERRERELNAKYAREQAAERSRQASREWAEKQRRRQFVAMAAMAGQAA